MQCKLLTAEAMVVVVVVDGTSKQASELWWDVIESFGEDVRSRERKRKESRSLSACVHVSVWCEWWQEKARIILLHGVFVHRRFTFILRHCSAHCYNAAQFNLISMRFNLVPVTSIFTCNIPSTSSVVVLFLLLVLFDSSFFLLSLSIYIFIFLWRFTLLRIVPFYSNPYTQNKNV